MNVANVYYSSVSKSSSSQFSKPDPTILGVINEAKPFAARLQFVGEFLLFHCPVCREIIATMDDFQTGEETTFVVDDVSNIIKESIENTIGGNAYQHNKVNQWTSNVVELCLNHLTKLNRPFKYIVTAVIMQKNGAGLHTASSCFWDNGTDGSCTLRWENKTMYCIVSVFGLAI